MMQFDVLPEVPYISDDTGQIGDSHKVAHSGVSFLWLMIKSLLSFNPEASFMTYNYTPFDCTSACQ